MWHVGDFICTWIHTSKGKLTRFNFNAFAGDLDQVIMSEYQENGEWDLLTTSIENRQFVWENKPNPFSYVRYRLLQVFLLFKILKNISPFCGATDTRVLDFWWCLDLASNPEWIPCFILHHLHAMDSSGDTCWPLGSEHGGWAIFAKDTCVQALVALELWFEHAATYCVKDALPNGPCMLGLSFFKRYVDLYFWIPRNVSKDKNQRRWFIGTVRFGEHVLR